jgi:hypothetical protein
MRPKILIPALITLMSVSAGAWAADDDGEATIRLMGTAEAELPGAVTKTISLPDHLTMEGEDQVAAVEKAKKGHDTANEARDNQNRAKGLDQAEAARENGREMAEKAKEARENRGRADPPGRPENPGRPDNPGRP